MALLLLSGRAVSEDKLTGNVKIRSSQTEQKLK